MRFSVKEIAAALNAQALGNVALTVTGAAEPAMAGPDQLALAMDEKFATGLAESDAKSAIVWDGADWA
ncbi:MAG: UDP-3-O-(3-hydroxymyristoyl)glucosamine N-acyltransferase, partial [Pseudomonadota bacterium]